MPMITTYVDCPTPTITRSGSFITVRFDQGLAIQLDHQEWAALVEAVSATTVFNTAVAPDRLIARDENEIRRAATIREALQ